MPKRFFKMKRRVEMTKIQAQTYEFIKQFIETKRCSPSFFEIACGTGRVKKTESESCSTVRHTLVSLRRRGLITWQERIPRSMKLLKAKTSNTPKLPVEPKHKIAKASGGTNSVFESPRKKLQEKLQAAKDQVLKVEREIEDFESSVTRLSQYFDQGDQFQTKVICD